MCHVPTGVPGQLLRAPRPGDQSPLLAHSHAGRSVLWVTCPGLGLRTFDAGFAAFPFNVPFTSAPHLGKRNHLPRGDPGGGRIIPASSRFLIHPSDIESCHQSCCSASRLNSKSQKVLLSLLHLGPSRCPGMRPQMGTERMMGTTEPTARPLCSSPRVPGVSVDLGEKPQLVLMTS